jgi:hypothetical protein
MPRRDYYHEDVKLALIKDGWTITDDPFMIEFEDLRVFADLGAEKLLAAEKYGRRIVVEIKVFGGPSPVADLEQALGQYGFYRSLLKQKGEQRDVFLAVAQDVYEDFLRQSTVTGVLTDQRVKLLVFQPEQRKVVQWIE